MQRCFAYLPSALVMFFKASSPLSIILTIFTLLVVIEKSVCADDHFELCDRSRACGGLNISFPFYIDERECGYPGYQVSCRHNRTTILKISGDSYIVHQIIYQNQTLHVSKDLGSACRYSFEDLANGQFDLGFGNSNFFFLSGCLAPLSDDLVRYKINCSGASPVLAIRSEDPNWDLAASECRLKDWAYVERADDDEGYLIGEELVRRGFVLEWIRTSECRMCEESGGKCGFDDGYYRFQCFCPDRPRADHCFSRNQKLRNLELGLGLCIGFLMVIVFFFLWWRHRSIKQSKDHPSIEAFLKSHGSLAPKRYSNSDIKKMTNSFKDKIGEGGYGIVYKGNLPDGRRQKVAVKVLNETKGDGEEFINEVASISKTSHINIVSLLGFCFDGPKRALVYEFMPNGSLDKYLCKGNPSKIKYMLGWGTLYKIAVGIARGLEYLHRGCNTRILHFDIKPHNILLSDSFCPKISDFGLAELCTRKDSVIPMQGTRGTPGYIAPEVFSRAFGGVSHKSDVYSYGMVVLDMVGARKDVDGGSSSHSTDEVYFPDSIYKCIEEEVLDYGPLEILNDERDCARKMKIVSLWCIQMKPSDRPSMRQVLDMLEGSLESLQIPPKPVFFSPPVSLQYSTTTTASGASKGEIFDK